jgi:hypothetical protein
MSGDTDLLLVNDDIVYDEVGNPKYVYGRDCILQDIKNMIRDKGYLLLLLAQRDQDVIDGVMSKIEQDVEDDLRITPGTATMTQVDTNNFYLNAMTEEYGPIAIELQPTG